MLGGLIVDFGGVLDDPDGRLLAAVRRLRGRRVLAGLLSNSDRIENDITSLFDDVVLSGDVGVGKPDPRIYLLAADRLRLTPEECVFVDDVPAFVHGAVRVGMVGVHHRDVESTLDELSALFGQEPH
jgi:HAD superfamily hydrolase (TIGR01509 family)